MDLKEKLRRLVPAIIFCICFQVLVGFFVYVDVYHNHFFEAGWWPRFYTFCRASFVVYFLSISVGLGETILNSLFSKQAMRLPPLERFFSTFFVGVSCIHIVMLFVGHFNLYYRSVAWLIASMIVFFSYFPMRSLLGSAKAKFSWMKDRSRTLFLAACAFALFLLLLVKGLYPSGVHDYMTHYFYYYKAVVANHGLLPNDVWYHYYYSKGAGTFYFSILLTDLLAPSLVSFCYFVASTACLISLMSKISNLKLAPYCVVFLYAVMFIYTPGPKEFEAGGGWGHFEKLHEMNTAFILAIIAMTVEVFESKSREARRFWLTCLSFACAATVILTTVTSFFLILFFGILMVTAFFRSDRERGRGFLFVGVVISGVLGSILLLNQYMTGWMLDQGMRFTLKFIGEETLYNWLSPTWFNFMIEETLAVASEQRAAGLGKDVIKLIFQCLRFDLISSGFFYWGGPFLIFPLLLYAFLRKRNSWNLPIALVLLFVAIGILGLVVLGAEQPISTYRYFSFFFPLSLLLLFAFWNSILSLGGNKLSGAVLNIGLVGLVSWTLWGASSQLKKENINLILTEAGRYLRGDYSLADAFSHQSGRPGNGWAHGAIFPGILAASRAVPLDSRIWSFHMHTYCMAPNCQVESYKSFKGPLRWGEVIFGEPRQAQAALNEAGLDLFFISEQFEIRDYLQYSLLFSPDRIGQHFSVLWQNSENVLLTWKRDGLPSLQSDWIERYRLRVEKQPFRGRDRAYELYQIWKR